MTWLPVIDDELETKKLDIPKFANREASSELSSDILLRFEKLGIKSLDINKLDIACIDEMLHGIEEVYKAIPELNGTINTIKKIKSGGISVLPSNDFKTFTLNIDEVMFSDYEVTSNRIKKLIILGMVSKGTTIKTSVYHEAGHMLEAQYIDLFYNKKDKESAWNECLAAETTLKQASKTCYNDSGKYNVILQEISQYATTTAIEGLAECVQAELSNFGNKFTKQVLHVLRRLK
ncbi:MAG: hypothetical protein RSC10_08990 [Longicatena sp.]